VRVVITGGQGQLARSLVAALTGEEVITPSREQFDITSLEHLDAAMARWQPDVVINTAAFHKVDLCESEPEQSFAVNAAAPQRLAAACRARGALFVHVSTDYVFNGRQRTPYLEEDRVDPLSVYGASKVAGEMAVRATTDNHLIVRTTGLYGHPRTGARHGNFVETMLRLAAQGGPISVVGDQVLTPSHTGDVAAVISELVRREARGTFHVSNSGECSWYEFAAEIFRLADMRPDLRRVSQSERPVPAARPAYSVLGHGGILRLGMPEIRPWREALSAYFAERATPSQVPS
jgi:dTDP-4-dehydrorhamnose reductase